jgi:histidyl-tRNA synthetase
MSVYTELPHGFLDREEDWLSREQLIVNIFRENAKKIDLLEIKTSPLGYSTTFRKGVETTGDKVFEFTDRGGRDLMLTPDSTPLVMRWYLEKTKGRNSCRVFFRSDVFRYRNKKLRYFHHIGFALLNEPDNLVSDIDEGSLLLVRTTLRTLVCGLNLPVSLKIGNFGVLYQSLQRMGLDKQSSELVLHQLRNLDSNERIEWIERHLPSGEEKYIFASILKLNFPLEQGARLDNQQVLERIYSTIQFAHACMQGHSVKIIISFDDLHSSELQAGIAIQFLNSAGKRLGDGGCYSLYAEKFDPRIHILKSVAFSLEYLIKEPIMSNDIHLKNKITVLSIDATTKFSTQVAESLIDAGYIVLQIRLNSKLKNFLQKTQNDYRWLILIGTIEETDQILSIRNIQTRAVYKVPFRELIFWLKQHNEQL